MEKTDALLYSRTSVDTMQSDEVGVNSTEMGVWLPGPGGIMYGIFTVLTCGRTEHRQDDDCK